MALRLKYYLCFIYYVYALLLILFDNLKQNNHNAKYKRYLLKSLDIKEKHKSNVIFCGSEIIQLKSNTKYPSYINNDENQSECLGLVLRTGFSTAKGKFMKTMLYNNQDVNYLLYYSYLFLLPLQVLILIINCFQDETRNKYYLFIRCLLIITTVVPFLLPMMLSITVQHDNNKTYILDFFDNNYVFVEYGTNNQTVLNNVKQEIKLFQGMLCISSTILEKLEDQHLLYIIIQFSIFARMSPKQKQKLLFSLKDKVNIYYFVERKSKLFKSLFIPLVLCIISALNYSEFLNYCLELTFSQNKELCMFICHNKELDN